MDDEKLKELIFIYFIALRSNVGFSTDGLDWEKGRDLPAWLRGPHWHKVGQISFNELETLIRLYLTKHYPMWDAIHGDPIDEILSNEKSSS